MLIELPEVNVHVQLERLPVPRAGIHPAETPWELCLEQGMQPVAAGTLMQENQLALRPSSRCDPPPVGPDLGLVRIKH